MTAITDSATLRMSTGIRITSGSGSPDAPADGWCTTIASSASLGGHHGLVGVFLHELNREILMHRLGQTCPFGMKRP